MQSDLQRGWSAEQTKRYGDWNTVSGFAGEGYTRGRSIGGSTGTRAENAIENTFDRAKTGAERFADKATNVADDMKDQQLKYARSGDRTLCLHSSLPSTD